MNRLHELTERIRGSLFYVPVVYVILSLGVAWLTLFLDVRIAESGVRLPGILSATVDSARAVLGTIAAATITFAGIAFSVSLLMIQQASSQFSPRVLYSLFRDRFAKRVMGIAVGTFTYCLLVLRSVRVPAEVTDTPSLPYVSVFVALILGIGAILAILALINHSAHSMEVGEIIRRITDETRAQIIALCPDTAGEGPPTLVEGTRPEGSPLVVTSSSEGWVQRIDTSRLLSAAEEGGVIRLDAGAGIFIARGEALCRIWPHKGEHDRSIRIARSAISIGRTRTMSQDMALGFRQLVDIALRALSPGINDPTTAIEAIVHIRSLLREILMRDLPPRVIGDDKGRRLFRPGDYDHADYVDLAIGQIRRAGATMPRIVEALLDTAGKLVADLEEAGLTERTRPLREQAALAIQGYLGATDAPLGSDRERVEARAKRLGLA